MPLNSDKPNKPSFSAKGGNWLDTTTTTSEGYDSRIGSTDTSFRQKVMESGEVALYEDRQREFNENPLFEFAVRFLAASLIDFDLGGDGKDDIENFQKKIHPLFRKELYSATVSAIRDGVGYLLKYYNRNEEIRQFKWDSTYHYKPQWAYRKPNDLETPRDKEIDADAKEWERRWTEISVYETSSIGDTSNMKGNWLPSYYIREYPCTEIEDYRDKKIAMLRLLDDDDFASGRAVGRSCYQHFKSLNQALKDDMAIIKKLLGTPLMAKLDLDDVDDANNDVGENLRDVATQQFVNSLGGIDWAKSDIIAIDKKHEVGYIGMMNGSSPDASGRILDIMSHIEPVLSAVLINFFIPLGLIEQTGANKSIIAQQVLQGRKDMIPLKESMSIFLKTQVFPHITDKEVDIFYPPNGVSFEMMGTFFSSGLTSREYTTDMLGIVDHGKTFVPIEKPMAGSGGENSSNDDNPEKRRTEPQRSQDGEKGV